MATMSSCNFHPYSEVYRCYKSRNVKSGPVYNSHHVLYDRRETDSFGEVSRERGEPARLTSGGIRATRHHQSAYAPAPLPTTSMRTLVTLPDDLIERLIDRLVPRIEAVIERAFVSAVRQDCDGEQEKTNAPAKEEEEMPSSIPQEEGAKEEVNLNLKEERGSEEIVGSISIPSLALVEIPTPTNLSIMSIPGNKIRSTTFDISTMSSPFLSTVRRLCKNIIVRNDPWSSRVQRHHKVNQGWWQFKCRGKSRPQQLKSRKRLEQSRRRIPIPSQHGDSLNLKIIEGICIGTRNVDFEDSRSNPFEEGEYDVILVSISKLRTRRGNIAWSEVLSWMKLSGRS